MKFDVSKALKLTPIVLIIFFILMVIQVDNNKRLELELEQTKKKLTETKKELDEYKATDISILPCPFCGSDDVHVISSFDGKFYAVECLSCWADNGYSERTKYDAIINWNAIPRTNQK